MPVKALGADMQAPRSSVADTARFATIRLVTRRDCVRVSLPGALTREPNKEKGECSREELAYAGPGSDMSARVHLPRSASCLVWWGGRRRGRGSGQRTGQGRQRDAAADVLPERDDPGRRQHTRDV